MFYRTENNLNQTMCICVPAVTVTDIYTAFSDTNRQTVLSLYYLFTPLYTAPFAQF
jgi:hypothetical protein